MKTIKETGALAYTHKQAIEHTEIAKASISNLAESQSIY